MRVIDKFISDAEARSSIGSTFIVLTYLFGGMLLSGVLIWSYFKSDVLFISILSGIITVYSLMIVIFISTIRSKLTSLQFKLLMTTSIFMLVLCMTSTIFFIIRATSSNKIAPVRERTRTPTLVQSYAEEE